MLLIQITAWQPIGFIINKKPHKHPVMSMGKTKSPRNHHQVVPKKATRKFFSCYNCDYTTHRKCHLGSHLKVHGKCRQHMCNHCDATYRNKWTLDTHILKKHPEFISSIAGKLYECITCGYKTTAHSRFLRHMSSHPETASSRCIHCHATFRNKSTLTRHLMENHNNFVTLNVRKMYRCSVCSYGTLEMAVFHRHLSIHPEYASNYTCIHCAARFGNKIRLDDHLLLKHPDFNPPVTSKVLECSMCLFKSTIKSNFDRHMSRHDESVSTYCCRFRMCKATFRTKILLDEHVVRKHPNLIKSITSKLYGCTQCTYKTVIKLSFDKHVSEHLHSGSSNKLNTCIHCDATFRNKITLDDHIAKKHQNFIMSVARKRHHSKGSGYKTFMKSDIDRRNVSVHAVESSTCLRNAKFKTKNAINQHVVKRNPNFITPSAREIYECTECGYKTTVKFSFDSHMSSHRLLDEHSYKMSRTGFCPYLLQSAPASVHCGATFKRKESLEDHVLKKHPGYFISGTKKMHECSVCSYKTLIKYHLVKDIASIHHLELLNLAYTVTRHSKVTCLVRCTVMEHRFNPLSIALVFIEMTVCFFFSMGKTKSPRNHHQVVPKKATRNSFSCYYCNYTTVRKCHLSSHLKIHGNKKCKNPIIRRIPVRSINEKHSIFLASETYSGCKRRQHMCNHCEATYINKWCLDIHMSKKHPEFISSIAGKLYECITCGYKTTAHSMFLRHTSAHPKTASCRCTHCHATSRNKSTLTRHLVKNHSNFETPNVRKMYRCTVCTYGTLEMADFYRHLSIHPEYASNYTCVHCETRFGNKIRLDDHLLTKHPDLKVPVTSKILECKICRYKSTIKSNFDKHTSMHHESVSTYCCRFRMCKATFQTKIWLDEHVVRKHPNLIKSITSKLYGCTQCTYKTVIKPSFDKHASEHLHSGSSNKLNTCIHCDATFRNKITLDDHIAKKHQNCIMSVARKKHRSKESGYKTFMKSDIDRHNTSVHAVESSTCLRNAKFKTKNAVNQHVVKRNPNFITPSAREINECTECGYKTTVMFRIKKEKSEADILEEDKVKQEADMEEEEYKLITEDCDIKSESEEATMQHTSLDDHIKSEHSSASQIPDYKTAVKCDSDKYTSSHSEHPDVAVSLGRKIHEYAQCPSKPSQKNHLDSHIATHSDRISTNICVHCEATFKSKRSLDDHLVKKDASLSTSVTSKVHVCTKRGYKTVSKGHFYRHNLIHHDSASNYKQQIPCAYCEISFKNKVSLDDHVVKKHPNFVTSIADIRMLKM
nr:unnamed protein product [Callosobruchus analis]